MSDRAGEGDVENSSVFPDPKLPHSVVLARQRQLNPVEIDFGSLLKGTPTGAGADLQLGVTASAAVVSWLRPTRKERLTEQPTDDLRLDVIVRGPFQFLFDEEDTLVNVSYGWSTSDELPALTEAAMCKWPAEAPSQSDGIQPLWDGRKVAEFASLSRFAAVLAPNYTLRIANGRSIDRWLNVVTETPHARLFADFLLKVVRPGDHDSYHIDYGLSALTVVSRRHLARCGQP